MAEEKTVKTVSLNQELEYLRKIFESSFPVEARIMGHIATIPVQIKEFNKNSKYFNIDPEQVIIEWNPFRTFRKMDDMIVVMLRRVVEKSEHLQEKMLEEERINLQTFLEKALDGRGHIRVELAQKCLIEKFKRGEKIGGKEENVLQPKSGCACEDQRS